VGRNESPTALMERKVPMEQKELAMPRAPVVPTDSVRFLLPFDFSLTEY